jgi:hypothetical protein
MQNWRRGTHAAHAVTYNRGAPDAGPDADSGTPFVPPQQPLSTIAMTQEAPPRKFSLIWPMFASVLLPLAAAWFAYPAAHLPPNFGLFPPERVAPPPPFNGTVFGVLALFTGLISTLLVFPRAFGFRPVTPPAPAPRAAFPWWFWPGAASMLFFWWLMWARGQPLGGLAHYAFTPLWWGFILVLDGFTHHRNNGRSLLSRKPRTLFMAAAVSLAGWCYFEYLDYFARSSWYYPNGHMPDPGHAVTVALFLVAYTTIWPVVFECYTLLRTFPALAVRYSNGPRINVPGRPLLWLGLALTALMVFWPYPLFWVVWIGPLCLLSGILIGHGVWTPYAAMAKGDWGPALLSSVSSMLIGFFWEMWNYGSAHPGPALQSNPNYWVYDIPYVNVIHLFSEMPLLGYFGYLPFGLIVWLLFIWAGRLLQFDTRLDL